MANLEIKTIEQLNKLAKSYKTNINELLLESMNNISTYDSYSITEDSVTEFNNIVNFYLNASVKDSETLDNADNPISQAFKDLLIKYYENGLTNEDIYVLLTIVAKYNKQIEAHLNDNLLTSCFGLVNDYSADTYFAKICSAIKSILSEAIYNGEFQIDTLDAKFSEVHVENILVPYLVKKGSGIYLAKKDTNGTDYAYANSKTINVKIIKYLGSTTYFDIAGKTAAELNGIFSNATITDLLDLSDANDYLDNYRPCGRKVTINGKEVIIYNTFIGDIKLDGSSIIYNSTKAGPVISSNDNGFTKDDLNIIGELPSGLELMFSKSELVYRTSDGDVHHTGKYLKATFNHWINGKIAEQSIRQEYIGKTYNKLDFYDKLINSSYVEFLSYVYLITQLGITDKYFLKALDASKESSGKVIRYVYENNNRSALYQMNVDGTYEEFDFSSTYSRSTILPVEGIEAGSAAFTPAILSMISYKNEVKGSTDGFGTTLYIKEVTSDGSEKWVQYGKAINSDERYFGDIQKVIDADNLFKYMKNICSVFYSQQSELSKDIELNKISDLSVNSFYDYIINQYLKTLTVIDYKDVMISKAKILYEFSSNPASSGNIKTMASIGEIDDAQKNKHVASFNLIDVTMGADEFALFRNIEDNYFKDDLGVIETNSDGEIIAQSIGPQVQQATTTKIDEDNTYSFSVGIVYKELNPLYRDIEKSDILELMIELLHRDNKIFTDAETDRLISSSVDNSIRNMSISNTTLLNDDATALLESLYCNPYTCRKARESDIIQYCAGSYINYGTNSTEMKEINHFLEIYQETREVYYRNLLNKSFTQDQYYDAYEKFMLATVSIERFISSKIDNIHDIDYFNETDIKNFLKTYGLSMLESTSAFVGKTEYQKIIIRNFNKLTRLKGSSKVINEIINVFSTGNIDIDINRYLIADICDLESSNNIDNESAFKSNVEKTYKIKIYDDSYKDTIDVSGLIHSGSRLNTQSVKINRFGQIISSDSDLTAEVYSKLANVIIYTTGKVDNNVNSDDLLDTSSSKFPIIRTTSILTPAGYGKTAYASSYTADNSEVAYYVTDANLLTTLNNFLYKIDQSGLIRIQKKVVRFRINYIQNEKTIYKYVNTHSYSLDSKISYSNYELKNGYLYIYYTVDGESKNLKMNLNVNEVAALTVTPSELSKGIICGICENTAKFKEKKIKQRYKVNNSNEIDGLNTTDYELDNSIGFIELQYATDNETKDIINSISNIKDYKNFVESDEYWDSEVVTEKALHEIGLNTVTTKYSAFDLSTNIFENLIKTRYCTSLIDYLHDKLIYIDWHNTDNSVNILANILLNTAMISGYSGNLSLHQLYTIIKLMYRVVVMTQYKIDMKSDAAEFDENLYLDENDMNIGGKYFGINRNANIATLLKEMYGNTNLVQGVLGRRYAERTSLTDELGNLTDKYGYKVTDKSVDIFNPYNNSETNVMKVFSIDSSIYPKYAFTEKTSSNYSAAGNKFLSQFKEVKVSSTVNKGLDSSAEVEEYLSGANYISLLNDSSTASFAWPLYLAECDKDDKTNMTIGITTTNLANALPSIYELIIRKIMQFPIDYLSGIKNPSYGSMMYIDNNFVNLADKLFSEFYQADENSLDLSSNLSDDEAILLSNNEYSAIKNYILNDMYVVSIDGDSKKLVPAGNSKINSTSLSEVTTRLISLLNEMKSIMESEPFMQAMYQLDENTQNLTTFIITAIKLFMSYTSEISEVRTTQKYETLGEYASPNDSLNMSSTTSLAEMSYYDDRVVVRKFTESGDIDDRIHNSKPE